MNLRDFFKDKISLKEFKSLVEKSAQASVNDKYPHKIKGECTIRLRDQNEAQIAVAKASLDELRDFIPEIDTDKNVDLLPVAFDSFVANRVNKNDDVLDTETSISIAETFINKPINVEHNRTDIVGVVTSFGFSEFDTDKPLSLEEARETKEPFNVVLGGVLWRTISNVPETVEESNNPESEIFESISASWEIGFQDFEIVLLPRDEKNITEGRVLNDSNTEFDKLSDKLRSNDGEGVNDKGERVYRKPVGEVLGMGIGLTTSPAADVKGVAAKETDEDIDVTEEANEYLKRIDEKLDAIIRKETMSNTRSKQENIEKKSDAKKNSQKISQNKKTVVKNKRIMKVEDITNEFLKEAEASEVQKFISNELEKKSEEFSKQKKEKEEALNQAREQYETLKTEHEDLKKSLDKLSGELESYKQKEEARAAEELFQSRMAEIDEAFEISNAERKVIASRIKGMNEDDYKSYSEELKVLLASKVKDEEEEEEELVTATNKAKASAKDKQDMVPNSQKIDTSTLKERFLEHFKANKENWKISV